MISFAGACNPLLCTAVRRILKIPKVRRAAYQVLISFAGACNLLVVIVRHIRPLVFTAVHTSGTLNQYHIKRQ